jgi:hypothetical protein
MTWDDHDIFDGYGSYPRRLQTCAVFRGLAGVARRFFLLFQQHTTVELAAEGGPHARQFVKTRDGYSQARARAHAAATSRAVAPPAPLPCALPPHLLRKAQF